MENLAIEQLESLIREKSKSVTEAARLFDASLTPEQQKLRGDVHKNRELHVDELIKKRDELLKKQLIEKIRQENPLIKEVPVVSPLVVPKTTISTPKILNNSRQHYLLPLIIKALSAKCHTWLVGPSGSGKSTLAAAAASELKLPYAALSVCSQTTKTDFLGYLDAHGVYRSTSFREIYENGGVFCLDEVDNGNANVLAVLNSALAGESNVFPDKSVVRHPNFVVIACANTFGLGSSASYVGRSQIDAATLDRFFFVEMPYDDGLEAHVAGIPDQSSPQWDASGKNVPSVNDWLNLVKKTRETVSELGIRTIISPRATYTGISLIKQGVPLNYLEKGLLYKSMTPDTIAKIRQA